ncbi:Protein MICAL-3, partial [Ophiophagus hannah]
MNQQDGEQPNLSHSLFDAFLHAKQCKEVLSRFEELCSYLNLEHTGQIHFYHKLKSSLNYWSAKALWTKLDKKAGHRDYDQGRACSNTKCLIIGSGPCGLRSAIELAFLGAHVVVVEKRENFSRNNVLHLWPFTIQDLRALGAKKFYGRFCTGTLDHISIRQLQLILLKVALLLGVHVHIGVQFKGLILPVVNSHGQVSGWRADLQPGSSPLSQYEFDILISAGGGRFVPEGFKRKETRGKLAIGITTNFINNHSRTEVEVAEISGVARIYNQKFFQNLCNKTGIDLENIVYYKDDTHYFVMTAKKHSLLKKGVILNDKLDIESLLSPENVNQEALLAYAKEAANFSTNYQLPTLQFALNHHHRPDVDMFDFTCMSRAENAALVRDCNGAKLLIGLVGDCLVEPFWPLGTGVGRGFLAAFDAAWMVKRWASGVSPLDVLAERESIYQQLSQTSPDNMNKNINQYSIDPNTRYPNINLQAIKISQVLLPQTEMEENVHKLYIKGDIEMEQNKRRNTSRAYEELLNWCQSNTASYHGIKVENFTHSWKSGLALCALIHHFRPDLLDFNSLDPNDPIGNNQLALDMAEQELGISPVLSSTEMASLSDDEQLGLITYLSQFYDAFRTAPEWKEKTEKPLVPCGTKSAILFLSKLQKTLSLSRKRNLTSPISLMRSSDACYFCGDHVYILERVSAEGRFFHRGCFKCHYCKITLRLGDFVFNEDDGNFYCMLHSSVSSDMTTPSKASFKEANEDSSYVDSPTDKKFLDLITEEERMKERKREKNPHWQNLDEIMSPFADQLPERQPELLQKQGSEGSSLFPSEKKHADTISSSQRPHQLSSLVGEEKPSDSVPKADSAFQIEGSRRSPENKAQGHSKEEPCLNFLSQGPGLTILGEGSNPTLEQMQCEIIQKKKICLSDLEKLELSRLSPISNPLDISDTGLEESSFSRESGSFPCLFFIISQMFQADDYELCVPCKQKHFLSFTEDTQYPTWKKTLLRRAKEAEMKRFCKAQAIQRRLEEIEVTFRDLEKQGIKVEQSLREEAGTESELKKQWMNQLLALIQKKNSLMSEESDLMIDWKNSNYLKTSEDHEAEKMILSQLVAIVNQRSALIEMQERKRLSELSEHAPVMEHA